MVVVVVTALAVAACGTSEPTPTPTATPRPTPTAPPPPITLSAGEREYFEQVQAAQKLTESKFENFGAIFGRAWPLRSLLIDALLEAGVGTAFTGTLEALAGLSPPERFRADHERMVDVTRELVRLDGEAAQAVRDDDLARFVLLNGELSQVDSSVAPGFSAVFCQHTDVGGALCGAAGFLGGEYGEKVHEALRRFVPGFRTATGVFGFPLSLRPEELAKVLATQASIFREQLEEVRAQVGSLTPPEELRADHDRLVAYYDGLIDGVSKLTAAVEAGEMQTAAIQLVGFGGQPCETRGSFSSSLFKELVGLHFDADLNTCDITGVGPGISIGEAITSDLQGPLLINGHLHAQNGQVRLCELLAESFPPQCGGRSLAVEGFDLTTMAGLTSEGSVTWSDQLVQLLGTVEGEVLTTATPQREPTDVTIGD